jgi:hypothetical protein
MAPEERQSKMLGAWVRAYDDVALVYGDDGPTLDAVRAQAPGLATRILDAEKRAEEKSVAWVGGGPGGVQAEINAWRDLWKEAIEMVSDGGN